MTRLVLDASVLLSGVIAKPTNPLGRLLTAARAGTFELVACPRIFKEFRRGLNKSYFTNRVLATEAAELLDAFELLAIILPDPPAPHSIVRDPDDDFLVALATTGNADAIVTGDRDLLDHDGLHPPAINARAACQLLGLPV